MTKTQVKNPKLENAAKEIQAILERDGLAIQPFLRSSLYGITPDARLVEINQGENETDSTGEDQPTETEQPTGADETPSTEG